MTASWFLPSQIRDLLPNALGPVSELPTIVPIISPLLINSAQKFKASSFPWAIILKLFYVLFVYIYMIKLKMIL